MMLDICTRFSQRVLKLLNKHDFNIENISKGHNSIENVDGVKLLVLCRLSDHALYLYEVS